jgi:hypothetical protein
MSLKGIVFRLAPWPLLRWAQQRLLGYPAPMRMSRMTSADVRDAIAGTGARLVAAVDDDSYGGHWRYTRYYVAAPGEAGETAESAESGRPGRAEVTDSRATPASSGSPEVPSA